VRQRRLELAVLAAGLVFLGILAVSFRPSRKPAAGKEKSMPAAPDGEDSGQATTLLDGFDFTESVGDKPLLRIQADRTVGYGPAAGLAPHLYAGEKVTLTVYPEDGAPVTVHSDRADYDERTRQSRLQGNVQWTDGDGSMARTETVVFHPGTRALEAPGRVRFTRGTIDLTAPSARYDVRERVVRFAGPVEGTGAGEDSAGFSRLTAREGLYRRDDGVLELAYVDGQSRTGDRFGSDRLVVQMAGAGRGRPESALATGNVRGILSAEGPASGAGGDKLERQFTGDEGVLRFDADGKAESFALNGSPALLWEARRRITAPRVVITFEKGRASGARAEGGVRIDSEASRAEAERGSVGFTGEDTARNATLEGSVRVEADGRRAEAARAQELDSGKRWLLTGGGGKSARVESGPSRLSADRIEIDRDAAKLRGEGHARAVFSPDARKKTRPVTFVGDSKRPVYGKADRIDLADATQAATLSGGASLWQDDSSLFADEIAISDAEKTVTATRNVRAVLLPAPEKARKASEPEKRAASIVSARRLLYRDADRSARFEGGVTVVRGGWRASGGESTAWLDEDGRVESVEISGDVRMTDRTAGRSGQADKALDYPKTGKTVLWGSPARVTDAGGNQVAGAILTIVDRGRSVEITAPEGGKTETIHRTRKD
jgi:lipopolysaccharide export system protein LptA